MTEDYQGLTPPPELVAQIHSDALHKSGNQLDYELRMIHAAYCAGADQELEACCEWVEREIGHGREWGAELREVRRPKPPSLAEQALNALGHLAKGAESQMDTTEAVDYLRRALERLQELENNG